MHPYDSSRAPSRTSTVSHTPIYDTLYSEYLRSFRALPGDRTGEEDLGFTAFSYGYTGTVSPYGTGPYGTGPYGTGSYGGWNGSSWQETDSRQPAYLPQPQPQPLYSYAGGSGYADGRQRQTGMTHVPAALPPAPRRGY
ncbi:hypothetical protein OG429_09985 [Streptomyces sp. NBC_00190]|uniref:hypothetical protein n=1 Tax=unclassified Streptomyces TaxID=2593676 RepID=UPI002E2A5F43|nr:hypothetical protein [Streptomyces sp. NBC_00190]WSZ39644.1 hypothetical protein OG239_12990 [Streptomyces sp. NBC_00868]